MLLTAYILLVLVYLGVIIALNIDFHNQMRKKIYWSKHNDPEDWSAK